MPTPPPLSDVSDGGNQRSPASTRTTRALLAGGVIAGPLFITTVVVQALTRDGFDPARHPLSLLGLGHLGWIQISNFLLTALLAIASAVGIRRALAGTPAGTWGPWLIGVYGLGLLCSGLLLADPVDGYPVGSLPGPATWHGQLHNASAAVSGLALDVAALVFARRFLKHGQRGWALYCLATVAADLTTAAAAGATGDFRYLLVGGAVIWSWASVMAARLLLQLSYDSHPNRTLPPSPDDAPTRTRRTVGEPL